MATPRDRYRRSRREDSTPRDAGIYGLRRLPGPVSARFDGRSRATVDALVEGRDDDSLALVLRSVWSPIWSHCDWGAISGAEAFLALVAHGDVTALGTVSRAKRKRVLAALDDAGLTAAGTDAALLASTLQRLADDPAVISARAAADERRAAIRAARLITLVQARAAKAAAVAARKAARAAERDARAAFTKRLSGIPTSLLVNGQGQAWLDMTRRAVPDGLSPETAATAVEARLVKAGVKPETATGLAAKVVTAPPSRSCAL
ncbi:hypothetical protein GGG17_05135 [Arsenicicoccus sp. MKL-02]|uniref:Uncharacterized protein n=1 Tax=Arsenicicoccus cauae TaxID=2663847 RepID=A0A6I3IBV4_9MICO|nr:hypothetical protein [Arsenicicoccus cauae]MTB71362.1 hypothetical protein [Arsenicicoccus cauae]